MTWYKTGTSSQTNGSPAVTGASTLWVDAGILNPGDIYAAPDGKQYEILSIQSNTGLTLASNYLGTTASGAAYAIMPIGLLPSALALQVKTTLTTANAALASAVLSTPAQSLTATQQGNARANISALGAADVGAGLLSLSVAGGSSVTLTAAQASAQFMWFTGVLTANINIIVPAAAREFFIYNNTTGAFTLTIKTAAGTGVTVIQGGRMITECDATNCMDLLSHMRQLGGSVDGTPIGQANASAGSFTTLTVGASSLVAGSGALQLPAGPDTLVGQLFLSQVLGINNATNSIGVAGQPGFGVGICPTFAPGFTPLPGHTQPGSDTYGNYQYTDGSVMVWIPAFYYKYGTGANGLAINAVDIQSMSAYASVAAANTAGYALHRAFYNGGTARLGVFVDKYLASNNGGGIASSLKNGNPLSSAAGHNPFSGLTGAPANAYYGAIAAAKTRGSIFFCNTRFIRSALALLANAHGAASSSATFCAWYSAGATNYPKGCNNNALGDANDGALSFVWDGYAANNSSKTGSANLLARTTHNGQTSGVADLNGCMWEVELGLTSDATNFYLVKTSVDVATITSGNTLATDAWGATGIAAMYNSLGATYQSLTASSTQKTYGSASQVLSETTTGTAWEATGAGIPLLAGVGGSNQFGQDGLWDYRPNELCVISGGGWNYGTTAGVWALYLYGVRGDSAGTVGFRAASYL